MIIESSEEWTVDPPKYPDTLAEAAYYAHHTHDPRVLAHIIKELAVTIDYEDWEDKQNLLTCLAAIKNLHFEKELATIALNTSHCCYYWKLRRAACQSAYLNSQTVLAKVALGDTNDDVRIAAIKKLTDAKTLKIVAFGDTSSRVRRAAVRRLRELFPEEYPSSLLTRLWRALVGHKPEPKPLSLLQRAQLVYERKQVPFKELETLDRSLLSYEPATRTLQEMKEKQRSQETALAQVDKNIADAENCLRDLTDPFLKNRMERNLAEMKQYKETLESYGNDLRAIAEAQQKIVSECENDFVHAEKLAEEYRTVDKIENAIVKAIGHSPSP